MKALIPFIVLLFISLACYSQTTWEEYNYLTKGYKIQIQNGLDTKKGYELKKLEGKTIRDRRAGLMALYRVDTKPKELAAYLIMYRKDGNEPEFICIPHPESDPSMMQQFYTKLHRKNDSSLKLRVITVLLSEHLYWD